MEGEKPAEEFSKEELRRQLYSSLRSTGVLDSMKGQLRARLLEHLRHHNGELIEVKKKSGKPSLIERLLSSLFLDYLESNGFTFTISVFMPESQMASWRPFAYEEMLELLHLDPSSDLHIRLKLGGEGRECLAYQLVTVLQQMAQRNCIHEVSTQTSPAAGACKHATRTSCTSPKDLERSMKEVEDAYVRRKEAHEAQRVLPYRSLQDKITILHQEFDARVNAEVALQVSRLRDYEINAARMDEAARYRRQLARDREELEDIHKSRMDRIKAREESLLERMLSKEKAIEASAYEQRQKILTEITSLRDRENKLRQFKEAQERREEKLDERELSLSAKEDEVVHVRKTLHAQADNITALRRKELEEQYKELCDRLQHDRTQLEAEREQMKEEKVAMAIELAASRSDKELIHALHHRLRVEEEQRLSLAKTTRELEEKLKQQGSSAPAPVNISDPRFEEQLRELQSELQQERLQRQASEKESKTLERKLQQKKVELAAARAPQGEWITEHKNLMATIHQQDVELQKKETKLQLMEVEEVKLTTRHKKLLLKIDHLDTLVKEAQEEKNRAIHDLEILQDQHKTTERELLETVTLLRKAKQALETERLDHCALQSHKKTLIPSIGVAPQRFCAPRDKPEEQNNSLFDPRPSADEIIRKKWESFRTKPRRESHDLWTHVRSDNAAKKLSHDQDLERIPVNHLPTSTISKPFSSGFDYQLLEMRDDGSLVEQDRKPSWKSNGEAQSSNPADMNSWKAIPVEELGVKSVTKTEALIETVGSGSIEEIYASCWDASSCKDAIPSWRKPSLPEAARPGSWNNGHEDLESSMVTSRPCDQSGFDVGVLSISRDSGNAWNLGQHGDHCHRDGIRSRDDMAFFQGEKKMAERYDYPESLSSLQGLEMTTAEIRLLQIHSPPVISVRSLKDSQEEMTPLEACHVESFSTIKGVATTAIAHRDTAMSEIECMGGLSNLYTLDVYDNHGHEGLKEKEYYATSNDGNEESHTNAHGFGVITDIQTSTDIVGNTDLEKDSRSSWYPEEHKIDSQPDELSSEERTSLEPTTEHVANHGDDESLTVHEDLAGGSDTKEDNEHLQEGAKNSWSLYLGEEEDNSEAEESLSQDTPSCKCLNSLKHNLESLEEFTQSGDELPMSDSGGPPRMDSQSEGKQHETAVDSATEVPENLAVKPETDNTRPLNLSAHSDDDGGDSKHMKCEEKIKENQHDSRSEIDGKAGAEEGETKQPTQGDEARETDAAEGLLPCDPPEAPEPVNLANEVHQVAMDLTSLVPIPTESEEETVSKHSPTPSISDDDSLQDPDKDLNKLMRCLGLTKDEQQKGSNKKEEEPLSNSKKVLNPQNEDSRKLMHENAVVPASGNMSGLPEMGEMLYKQEMQAREKEAQKNLPVQDSTTEARDRPERVEVKGNKNINLDSPQASGKPLPGHDRHAFETLRTSIVMRKQELSTADRETEKGSPRLVDGMDTPHKTTPHPTLALAIRNNRLVKLETEKDEQTLRSSFLTPRHIEKATMSTKSIQDEKQLGRETPRSVDEIPNLDEHASEKTTPTPAPAPCGETLHSSTEESIYQGDSFEEEEEDESDQEPTYSEESCANSGTTRVSSEQAPSLQANERAPPRSKPKVETQGNESKERSPESWGSESEQGSYSPDEDDIVADLSL